MKQIIFYYPQHFNRSAKGDNPFFNALINTCRNHNIPFVIMEEPDKSGKPHNEAAVSAKRFLILVLVVRKLLSWIFRNKNFYQRERIAGKIVNILTLGFFRSNIYITISGSMYWMFAAINPKAQVYDLQHGILCKQHKTFFDKKSLKLKSQYYDDNLNILFWGEGFRKIFIQGEEEIMKNKAFVIGYPIKDSIKSAKRRTHQIQNLLYSLQFTDDFSKEKLEKLKQQLIDMLEETKNLGVAVWLKHHPRFNNCINISDVLTQYTHAHITQDSLERLNTKIDLHITYYSTTAFEYACLGIPTYFLNLNKNEINMFYSEFNYPLYAEMPLCEVIKALSDIKTYNAHSELLKNWYSTFYSSYNEDAFLKLITQR